MNENKLDQKYERFNNNRKLIQKQKENYQILNILEISMTYFH